MPNVSVVIPTFNHERFVMDSVRSVLTQTYDDFELIIVNDGSTDATTSLLNDIQDPRVTLLHQENQGLAGALNSGFAFSSGAYLTWLASDNLYKPQFLEHAVRFMQNHPDIGLIYASFENVDADGRLIDYHFLEPYYPGLMQINPGAVGVVFLYNRSLAEHCGDYIAGCNDLDYWLRASRKFKFAFLPEVLGSNRKHRQMQSVTKKENLQCHVDELLEREQKRKSAVPDPCLQAYITRLRRQIDQFHRALEFRIKETGPRRLIVIGDPPLQSIVVSILIQYGHQAQGITADNFNPSQDCLFLPLSPETENILREKKMPYISLGCAHNPNHFLQAM